VSKECRRRCIEQKCTFIVCCFVLFALFGVAAQPQRAKKGHDVPMAFARVLARAQVNVCGQRWLGVRALSAAATTAPAAAAPTPAPAPCCGSGHAVGVAERHHAPRSVLVGVDGSAGSRLALQRALEWLHDDDTLHIAYIPPALSSFF